MRPLRFFLLILGMFPFLTGCGNILYVSRLGWHQSFIMHHSVPVEEILADENASALWKEKIIFIQEVKEYGEEKLGLKRTHSYSKFFENKGPILYMITACEKDRFQLYTWNFPITGRVTYKGFFTREGVLEERQSLERKGLDTFVQQAAAYSTLGKLKEPIFSSMMKWDQVTLANLILHEMCHTTIYFKGEADFNEQLATFIGNQGSINFLIKKYGVGSKEVTRAIQNQEDDLLFSNWVDQVCQRLSTLYAKEISKDEKLRGREELFRSIKEEFREIKGRLKTDYYKDFEKRDLNNAVFLAYRRYIHRLDKFEAFHESMGKDLRKVVKFFKELRASTNRSALASFIQ
jgi:predicted aminopeptidase